MKISYKIAGLTIIVVLISLSIFTRIFKNSNQDIQIERNPEYFTPNRILHRLIKPQGTPHRCSQRQPGGPAATRT